MTSLSFNFSLWPDLLLFFCLMCCSWERFLLYFPHANLPWLNSEALYCSWATAAEARWGKGSLGRLRAFLPLHNYCISETKRSPWLNSHVHRIHRGHETCKRIQFSKEKQCKQKLGDCKSYIRWSQPALQNIFSGSTFFLSNQLIKMLKLIRIAMIQLEFIMYYANFNLFYLM